MSQIVLGITDQQLKAIDARAAALGKSREEIALAALEAELDRPLPKPKAVTPTAAVPKHTAGADKKEE